ncbi:D-alanyl-D-alanine carboxypeptidase family protein [Candidatus Peregrinibacteria bacterium]|nr:D-alanyl-D-alanine carboxypeptidase family protein [Candidatus Peregrinibacteria bacterium]
MKLRSTLLMGTAFATLSVAEQSEAADDVLVDLQTYVHDLVVSKPYATTHNFTGKVVYPASDTELVGTCKMRESAARKIAVADKYIKTHGFNDRLMAWDCYRPKEAQQFLWSSYGCDSNPGKCSGYIAAPGKSKHNAGYAIDASMANVDGVPIKMPTEYDDFSASAHPGTFTFGNNIGQNHWSVLNDAMKVAGCKVNPSEWWHFDC